MRYCFLLFLTFLLSAKSYAQIVERFIGIVQYSMISEDSLLKVDLTAYFGPDMIRIDANPRVTPDGFNLKPESILINLRDSTIDRITKEKQIVERERMNPGDDEDIPVLSPEPSRKRRVAGYSCQPLSVDSVFAGKNEEGEDIRVSVAFSVWYAESLSYPVPPALARIQIVPLLTNGKVALASEMYISNQLPVKVFTEAVSVVNVLGGLDPSIFTYPEGVFVEWRD